MNRDRYTTLFLVSLLCFGFAGCETHEGAMVGQRVDSSRAPNATIHLNEVVILDRSLQDTRERQRAGRIAIERKGAVRKDNGALEPHVTIRNRTEYQQQIECRVQFFGADEEHVEGPSAWQRLILPPHGIATYRETSLGTDNIEYYYIEVREGR